MDGLDNPFWTTLTTVHRAYAVAFDGGLRFAKDIAPFAAIAEPGPIGALDEPTFFLGPRPIVPPGYRLEDLGLITQMVCDARQVLPDGPPIRALSDHEPIRALAALVYPHFFRQRTAELGRYHGIGDLEAMIGERMALPGLREVSAVCTHPDHTGRGLARRLLAFATNAIFDAGEQPFLQVSPTNTRAIELYERNGYRKTRDLPFFSVRR
jgi:GNAT superfamily N-acetyltransferase